MCSPSIYLLPCQLTKANSSQRSFNAKRRTNIIPPATQRPNEYDISSTNAIVSVNLCHSAHRRAHEKSLMVLTQWLFADEFSYISFSWLDHSLGMKMYCMKGRATVAGYHNKWLLGFTPSISSGIQYMFLSERHNSRSRAHPYIQSQLHTILVVLLQFICQERLVNEASLLFVVEFRDCRATRDKNDTPTMRLSEHTTMSLQCSCPWRLCFDHVSLTNISLGPRLVSKSELFSTLASYSWSVTGNTNVAPRMQLNQPKTMVLPIYLPMKTMIRIHVLDKQKEECRQKKGYVAIVMWTKLSDCAPLTLLTISEKGQRQKKLTIRTTLRPSSHTTTTKSSRSSSMRKDTSSLTNRM